MAYNPLVSVGVVTYNSANYIVEALDSIKNQTYENIELIISDDCSKDNTIEICSQWLEKNKSRFVNTVIVTVEKNTGTSANCNRVLSNSKGEWLKLAAGDDAFFPDCIESFVDYSFNNPNAKCILGTIREYKNTFDEENVVDTKHAHFNNNDIILTKSAEEQFQKFIYGNTFVPPATFMNVQTMIELGGFEEKYGILEDEPFYFKMLKAGYKIYGLNKNVAKYRSSDTNVWGGSAKLFNYRHQQLHYQWQKDMCFPYYKRRERVRSRLFLGTYSLMDKLGLNKKTKINRAIELSLHFTVSVLTLDFNILKRYFNKALGR